MLPNPTATSRPRPPAQMRRSGSAPMAKSSKSASSPPPPYAASRHLRKAPLETLLGSPVRATYQIVGRENEGGESEDWLNEKSREELSELLIKANGIIKNRENELDHTSAICKTLYEDKIALQSKHQELLSRIPVVSPSRAPSASTPPSPTPLTHTPSHSISDFSHSVSDSFPVRIRKISISPQDISLLADQNAELLQKLEKLESESTSAEMVGRRALKKLEKDISLLRDELEKTQGELEQSRAREKVNSFGWDPERVAEEMARKRMERESRIRALRSNSSTVEQLDDSIRDFAPGGPLCNGPSTISHHAHAEPLDSQLEPLRDAEEPPEPQQPLDDPWKTPPRSLKSASLEAYTLSEPQLALISQLLMKIQELEDANANIIEQQKQTSSKLQAVQRETENISKIYECLSDVQGVKLELVEDSFTSDTSEGLPADGENTIRFRSLRKTLEGHDVLKVMGGDISEFDISPLNLASLASSRKSRKSVMDLFSASPEPSSSPREKSSTLPIPFPSPSYDSWSNDNGSPSLSNLSLERAGSESPLRSVSGQNLRSELGSEYGDDWSLNAPNHHLRTSSLYNLSQLQLVSPTPSRRTSLIASGVEEVPTGLKTPVSNVLQLTLEPPTPPTQFPAKQSSSNHGSLRADDINQAAKKRRMSQTIRARTNRWIDGRFTDNVLSPSDDMKPSTRENTMADLEKVFRQGVDKIAGSDSTETDPDKELTVAKVEKHGFSNLILELWLWLQFIVIIVVFLFAMAKRGPKSILGETNQGTLTKRR